MNFIHDDVGNDVDNDVDNNVGSDVDDDVSKCLWQLKFYFISLNSLQVDGNVFIID